ncbi:hypothetical protein LZ30DRAFT_785436 [Colletotrichum cereale]|nr:hypothetical protein LZ30DRAFT_785436 [Colletotrichum cereale]
MYRQRRSPSPFSAPPSRGRGSHDPPEHKSAHPQDAFNMVRFSAKISRVVPRESSASPSASPEPPDGSFLDRGLQPFELYFHMRFVADLYRPISLHFDTAGGGSSVVVK